MGRGMGGAWGKEAEKGKVKWGREQARVRGTGVRGVRGGGVPWGAGRAAGPECGVG